MKKRLASILFLAFIFSGAGAFAESCGTEVCDENGENCTQVCTSSGPTPEVATE